MAGNAPKAGLEGEKAGCLFCSIRDEKRDQFKIEHEDADLICFHDIRPGAELHLLITPRKHIDNITRLTEADVPLLRQMEQLGRQVLTKKGYQADRQKLGFHIPPLVLVGHLHLHVFGLPHTSMFARAFFAETPTLGFRHFIPVAAAIKVLEKGESIGLRSSVL